MLVWFLLCITTAIRKSISGIPAASIHIMLEARKPRRPEAILQYTSLQVGTNYMMCAATASIESLQ